MVWLWLRDFGLGLKTSSLGLVLAKDVNFALHVKRFAESRIRNLGIQV